MCVYIYIYIGVNTYNTGGVESSLAAWGQSLPTGAEASGLGSKSGLIGQKSVLLLDASAMPGLWGLRVWGLPLQPYKLTHGEFAAFGSERIRLCGSRPLGNIVGS